MCGHRASSTSPSSPSNPNHDHESPDYDLTAAAAIVGFNKSPPVGELDLLARFDAADITPGCATHLSMVPSVRMRGSELPTMGLFDCDGVLVDSDTAVVRSWTRWAQEMSLQPDVVLPTVYGRRSADTVAHFMSPAKQSASLELIDRLELEDATATTVIPGAAELLASIPGHRWATVTSASRELAGARLAAAGLTGPAVLMTAGDVSLGKPHPEGYLAAARLLGVPAYGRVVVEDAPASIRARPGRRRAPCGGHRYP